MKYVDEPFERFAAQFTGASRTDDEIAFAALLDRSQLDFKLESLRVVDRYLVALHERRDELGGRPLFHTVLWGGAYVGEVIRREAKAGRNQTIYDEFHWVDYDDYVAAYPDAARFVGPRDVATYAFLVRPSGTMNVPIGKVQKCIANGIEDSVHFHAECELKNAIVSKVVGRASPAQMDMLRQILADAKSKPASTSTEERIVAAAECKFARIADALAQCELRPAKGSTTAGGDPAEPLAAEFTDGNVRVEYRCDPSIGLRTLRVLGPDAEYVRNDILNLAYLPVLDAKIAQFLESADRRDVLRALGAIEFRWQGKPGKFYATQLARLREHTDAEIRDAAARAAGLAIDP